MDTLRRLLLAVLLMGLTGTTAELLLTGHTGEFWQKVPIALMAAAMPAVVMFAFRQPRWLTIGLRALMVAFVAAGALGTYFHYESNAEFALELAPGLSGFALVKETMTRQTPPPLAPGTMIMLGLLGLIATTGLHSANRPSRGEETT